MATTYGYHYGGKINRGERYGKAASRASAPKANLGEGRSAKNLEQQLAEQGVKANKNQNIRLLAAQEAVKNTNFDAFKKFSDEQIRQMYPDDPQLANYLINGKNGTFMRDVKSLNEDAIAYEKKYGKVSDVDVDSIIDAAIQKRDKKSLEDMGILTNDAIERWIDRHPNNSGFGETGNILKSWRDEPAKYVIEPEVTDVNNAYKDPNAAKYASPEFKKKPLEEQWTEALNDSTPEPKSETKPAETKANQPITNPEKQAAQDMVNSSKSKNVTGDAHLSWYNQPWRDIVNNTRDRNTPSPVPPNRLTGDAYPIVRPNRPYEENIRKQGIAKSADYPEFTELPMSNYYPLAYADGVYTPHGHNKDLNYSNTRHASNYPTRDYLYLDGQYPFNAYEGMGNVEFVPMYNPHYPRERLYSRPEDYYPNPFEKRRYDIDIQRYPAMSETQRKLRDTAEVLGLGLGGIGLVGYIGGQQAQERQKQSQTQAPYQMEPEPVNEAVAQAELTPEQQFVLQSTSPFDYAKGANLFDLYDRYGSPNSPIKIDPVKDKELIDEAMSDFESPQNPPAVGTNINDANLVIPDADEAPEELNDAMLDARPDSFWKASRGAVASRVNAAKNAAQNAFGRTLTRSKAAPKASNESASNIQDTSNGPVVLNAPRQRKTNNRVNYQDAAKQILGASEAVNNLAREAYNFNRQQSSQKPEAALAQSLLRAQQESRANRGDAGLQQYRYQSLLNSGLRGMTPDEAIRSGLLTPEQVQVLMRGPY